MVRSNEKLLKALITLLALKDEHLLEELRTIFSMAHHHGSEIGEADARVWAEVRRELALIDALVYGEDERPSKAAAEEQDEARSFNPRPSSGPQ